MKRTELIDILNLVNSGLSGNNLIPVLSHVWFLEDSIMTYNDSIGVKDTM